MRITVANKTLSEKPVTQAERGKYFSGIRFDTIDTDLEGMREMICRGVTMAYLFRDKSFTRSGGYMQRNYVGTQVIIVDVDKSDIPPREFVSRIKNKPTIFHTTFWNLTEYKDYKYCFHLIYVLDHVVYGDKTYRKVFHELTSDFYGKVDPAALDPHRCFFTTSSDLNGFEYECTGIVYETDKICANIGTCDTDKPEIRPEIRPEKTVKHEKQDKKWDETADKDFMHDFNSMKRSDFIDRYAEEYPLLTSTPIEYNENGYADLTGIEYYKIDPLFRWDPVEMKMMQVKVMPGRRTSTMYKIACLIFKITPGITLEWLIAAVTRYVYENFDNSDKELTNSKIYLICKGVWESRDDIKVGKSGQKIKVNTGFWAKEGLTRQQAVGKCRKMSNEERIMSLYDISDTIENNIEALRQNGVKTTKRYVKDLLLKNGIDIVTDKDIIKAKVIELRMKGMTTTEISDKLNISQPTVSRILNKIA